MIEVIKYLEPLWYYNLKYDKTPSFYFLDYRKLSEDEKKLIDYDTNYISLSLFDAGYQAFKKGIISNNSLTGLDLSSAKAIPLTDQYRFAKKYYHWGWTIYLFIVRILALNNPIKESKALLKSWSVKKESLYAKTNIHILENIILPANPKITLIIPTLNRYDHLKNILDDLSKQTIAATEIIVVDQSDTKDNIFYNSFKHLPLKIIYQTQKGQWLARNEAIRQSVGDFILFADDDSRVNEDWTEQHLKCISFFNADISAGVSLEENKPITNEKTFFHWAEEFDSGNAMVDKSIFEKVGLFDDAYNGLRMGDAEFGLRAYLLGLKSISNPLASRKHVHTLEGGLRYWGSNHSFRPLKFWDARPNKGVLYFYNSYFNNKYLLSFLLIRIYNSYCPPKIHNIFLSKTIGFILFIGLMPYWISKIIYNYYTTKSDSHNSVLH